MGYVSDCCGFQNFVNVIGVRDFSFTKHLLGCHVEVQNGNCVTNGDQKCFRRPSFSTTSMIETTPMTTADQTPIYVCALEGSTCQCSGLVRYGNDDTWTEWREVVGSIECTNNVFSDPIYGVIKVCQCNPISNTMKI